MTDSGTPLRARTLEYKQAMKDFRIMFPTLERDTIECVLRSNAGHVDSTIDQLLQLTQDMSHYDRCSHDNHVYERFYLRGGDSCLSDDFTSEHLSTSINEDQPPKYTPDNPYMFSCPIQPIKRFRDWNPPLLGTLPDDFLRIVSVSSSAKIVSRHGSHCDSQTTEVYSHHFNSHQSNRRSSRVSSSKRESSSHVRLQRRKTTGQMDVSAWPLQPFHNSPLRSAPVSRSMQRNNDEQSQYTEDRRVALMLQNEEFLRELQQNEQFLQELSRGDASSNNSREVPSKEKFRPISVNPLQELPADDAVTKSANDRYSPAADGKDFKESLKHMNKSSKKSFVELARKFNARRKSYKSVNDSIDPVFAKCDDK